MTTPNTGAAIETLENTRDKLAYWVDDMKYVLTEPYRTPAIDGLKQAASHIDKAIEAIEKYEEEELRWQEGWPR